jgi:hypothetical protein
MIGGLVLMSLEGYLEYKYKIFGAPWNIGLCLTFSFLAFTAYRYDHRGMLLLAILLAITWASSSWAGSGLNSDSILTFDIVTRGPLADASMVAAATCFVAGMIAAHYDLKSHFLITYAILCSNILFVAAIKGFMTEGFIGEYIYIVLFIAILFSLFAVKLNNVLIFIYSWVYFYLIFTLKMIDWIEHIYPPRWFRPAAETAVINQTLILYFLFSGPLICIAIRLGAVNLFQRQDHEHLSA